MKDSRIFREWLDKNGKQIKLGSTPTYTSTNTNRLSRGYFKNKFEKLNKHLNDLYGFCDTRWLADSAFKTYYNKGNDKYLIEIVTDFGQYPIEFLHERVHPTRDQITHDITNDYTQLLDKFYDLGIIKDKKLCE